MPAGSEPPGLPATFRPRGVRLAVLVLGIALVGVIVAIWVGFPENVRDQFTIFQRLTVLALVLAVGAAGYALARSRVEARPDGLLVVNGYRARTYRWSEIAGVTLRAGAPWAVLELADGTTASAMGIQGSDGPRAVAQVRQLRVLLAQRRGSSGSEPGGA